MDPVYRLIDRFFVWLVATLASAEAIGQAIDAFLDARFDKLALWAVLGALMVLGTFVLEIVKSRRRA